MSFCLPGSRIMAAFASAAVVMLSMPGSAPQPELIQPLDHAAARQTNDRFLQTVIAEIEHNGDMDRFTCFNPMPYEAENPAQCRHDSLFTFDMDGAGSLYLNGKFGDGIESTAAWEKHFPTDQWYEISQLYHSAHEFAHYLQYKQESAVATLESGAMRTYGPNDPPPVVEINGEQHMRNKERDADLFALDAIRHYYPDRAAAFETNLRAYRAYEQRVTGQHGHSGLLDSKDMTHRLDGFMFK